MAFLFVTKATKIYEATKWLESLELLQREGAIKRCAMVTATNMFPYYQGKCKADALKTTYEGQHDSKANWKLRLYAKDCRLYKSAKREKALFFIRKWLLKPFINTYIFVEK